MNSLLMLPLVLHDTSWGLVEVYDVRLRRFDEDDVELATRIVEAATVRLDELESQGHDPAVVGAASLPLLRPIGRMARRHRRRPVTRDTA